VLDHLDEYPNLTCACETVSARLGFGAESLRRWVRQTQIDQGQREGVTSVGVEEAKVSRREVRRQATFVELLNIRGMAAGRLAKSISDAGWALFLKALASGAEHHGRKILLAPAAFPSSRTC
jgi:transposase